ncbi:twin-arginine translocase TatA/TatE family subunit [Planctomycetota bacterium]
MFGLGMGELMVILLIIILLFGASRVPEIARSLGRSVQEFKKAGKDMKKEVESTATEVVDEPEEEKKEA